MKQFKRAAAAVALALAALVALAGSAQAYNMAISLGGSISADSEIVFRDSRGIINVTCKLTLDGTLAAGPIAIATGNQIGQVTGATVGTCRGGSVTFLVPAPWSVTINTALGTLPNAMTGLLLDIRDFAFELTVEILRFTVRCLYRGPAGVLVGVEGSNPYRTRDTIVFLGNTIAKDTGTASCPAAGAAAGTARLTPTQTITVT